MSLLRIALTLIVLLSLALPVSSRTVEMPGHCPMSCCASLKAEGMGVCGCAEAPSAPTQPSSGQLPPASGRDLVPQFGRVEAFATQVPVPRAEEFSAGALDASDDERAARPHVRLSVLHCSFLI